MGGAVVESESGEGSGEGGIHVRSAAAVEPVEAADAMGSGWEVGGIFGEGGEVFLSGEAAEPVEGIANGGLAGFVAVEAGEDAIFYDACDARDVTVLAAVEHMAGAGAHDHDEGVGFGSTGAGDSGVGVDDGGADRGVFREAKAGSDITGEGASEGSGGDEFSWEFLGNEIGEIGVNGGEVVVGGEAIFGRPEAFISGLAGGTDEGAGELPDEPVAGFEPDFGGGGDIGRGFEGFEDFWEEPFFTDEAAVAGEEGFVALFRDGGHAGGLSDGAVMFPELGPGLGGGLEFFLEAEGGAILKDGEHGAAGEIDADADDGGIGFQEGCAGGFGGGFQPVGWVLVGGLGGER